MKFCLFYSVCMVLDWVVEEWEGWEKHIQAKVKFASYVPLTALALPTRSWKP